MISGKHPGGRQGLLQREAHTAEDVRVLTPQSTVAGPASLNPDVLSNCLGNSQCKFELMILKFWRVVDRVETMLRAMNPSNPSEIYVCPHTCIIYHAKRVTGLPGAHLGIPGLEKAWYLQ